MAQQLIEKMGGGPKGGNWRRNGTKTGAERINETDIGRLDMDLAGDKRAEVGNWGLWRESPGESAPSDAGNCDFYGDWTGI
jgi:hypothetical protein